MLPETDRVPAADPSARDYLAEYARHQLLTGRGNSTTTQGAKTFMRQWPHPQDWASQPLAYRLAEGSQTTSFLISASTWIRISSAASQRSSLAGRPVPRRTRFERPLIRTVP